MSAPRCCWAPSAWVDGRWQPHVLMEAGDDGHWAAVTPGVEFPPPDTLVLAGPALPPLVDAHGHAFQRAFAGLSERRDGAGDDFWSWRERMYAVAGRITPEQLHAVATHLYYELVRGGYTQVCEFHYLHHHEDGSPYGDPLTMASALADAAAGCGIGLTLLPVLYERAGFQAAALRDEQRRFRAGAQDVRDLQRAVAAAGRAHVSAGVAVHSLRAASPASIRQLAELVASDDAPVHIHVAEQAREVQECLDATGARPIEWLAREGFLDSRWQLVHATHATPGEIDAVAASGAGVVLCPSTEANLGDGLPDLDAWLARDVPLSIGSDSHVTRAWREELRLLEYGQRLQQRRRNVAAAPERGQAVQRRPALPARARRRRPRRRLAPLGPRRGRARRSPRRGPEGPRAARRAGRPPARRAGLLQPRAAVARRDGGRALGRAGPPPRRCRRGGRAFRGRHACAVGRGRGPALEPARRVQSTSV